MCCQLLLQYIYIIIIKKKPTIAINVLPSKLKCCPPTTFVLNIELPSKLKCCPPTTFVLNIEVNVANYFISNLLQQKTRIATNNCELNNLYNFLLAG
jgi:hypothetical protein